MKGDLDMMEPVPALISHIIIAWGLHNKCSFQWVSWQCQIPSLGQYKLHRSFFIINISQPMIGYLEQYNYTSVLRSKAGTESGPGVNNDEYVSYGVKPVFK